MLATEHIVLEAETREVPQLQSRRRVHASVQCRSRLLRRNLQPSLSLKRNIRMRRNRISPKSAKT